MENKSFDKTILGDSLVKMNDIEDNSIDLILTDPPYIISQNTGMENFNNFVKEVDKGNQDTKTLDDWNKYISKTSVQYNDEQKNNYLKYGTIYGKKYAVKTDYGSWDSEFTMQDLKLLVELSYSKLKNGGTCIIFFDIWKLSYLKEIMELSKFKQLRFIE